MDLEINELTRLNLLLKLLRDSANLSTNDFSAYISNLMMFINQIHEDTRNLKIFANRYRKLKEFTAKTISRETEEFEARIVKYIAFLRRKHGGFKK